MRSPELDPVLLLYFLGHAPSTPHIVFVDMQVLSTEGGVRIVATNNPDALLVTHAGTVGARVSVPVPLTTDLVGDASVLMKLNDQTEVDWFGAELWLTGAQAPE